MALRICATFLVLGGLANPLSGATDRSAALVNLTAADTPLLASALEAQGCKFTSAPPTGVSFAGDLVVWESRGGHSDISPAAASALGEFVRHGGSLLLGLDPDPGLTPIRLAFLSPTMAWETRRAPSSHGNSDGEITSAWRDPDLFKDGAAFTLPYHFSIRPFHAVERGIARYDQLNKTDPWLNTPHAAGDFFWTRPLLNRDWQTRLTGNDRAASPLLITGRYGAGRVAVFASSLQANAAALAPIWTSLAAWLMEAPAQENPEPVTPQLDVATTMVPRGTTPDGGSLRVTLKNSAAQSLPVQVVARILTWEHAPIGDETKSLTLAPGQETSFDLPLPEPGPTQYQALSDRDAFIVRLGILSAGGANLLAEKVVPVDLTPIAELSLATDNLDQIAYPYPGAPDATLNEMSDRMGMPVMAYAYLPGTTVHAMITLANGLRNLAPLAVVEDETDPGNPSAYALNDGSAHFDKKPRDSYQAYGAWLGRAGVDNILRFHFAAPVRMAAITLMGSALNQRDFLAHNPGAVTVECDGHQVASDTTLDARFLAENGLVRIAFSPVTASDVRLILPWIARLGGKPRVPPCLGEIGIEASTLPLPPPVEGNATLILHDSFSGLETTIATKHMVVAPGTREEWPVAVILPATNARYYQLEARFGPDRRSVPVLAIAPQQTVIALDQLRPKDAPQLGFIVTRGFRNGFDTAIGTQQIEQGWEGPDDLIWAYSRQAKQTSARNPTRADWLYLTTSDLRHYSNPWTLFPNGENLFDAMTPVFLEHLKRDPHWTDAKKALFFFSDRWDSGPSMESMYTWQDIVAFDEYLRAQGKAGLTGRTHAELGAEIQKSDYPQWCQWQQARYLHAVTGLSQAIAAEGKQLVLSSQGIPLLPNAEVKKIAPTIQGMSDDNTWGLIEESVPLTTGRQMGLLALNPDWKIALNFVWGWDSAVLGNLAFYAAVGTTEPSRRHYDDVAWRAVVDSAGHYLPAATYGFNANGGVSYTMALNDWQERWRAQERFSLIRPDAPLGAGLIVSSSVIDAPDSVAFNGGGMGGSASDNIIHGIAQLFERLHDAGLSVPFTSNIKAVAKGAGTAPLIVQDLSAVTPEEVQALAAMGKRGVKIAAFAGAQPSAPDAAALFGLDATGAATSAIPAGTVGASTLLANGNFLYIPWPAATVTAPTMNLLAPILRRWLDLPITFPNGTMGYGFSDGPQRFIVVEDWMEKGRTVTVRYKSPAPTVHAIELNDHQSLTVNRDGTDWLIQLPLRPGDGDVIVLEEQ